MATKSLLAAILLIALTGCSGHDRSCHDDSGNQVEITEEMARAMAADEDTLPLFTREGSFYRHVALSELDDGGYMLAPKTYEHVAMPIRNEQGEVIALQGLINCFPARTPLERVLDPHQEADGDWGISLIMMM